MIAKETLLALSREYEASTKGTWHKGKTTHETICDGPGIKAYHIAEFHHASDASFCDVAHEFFPLMIAGLLGAEEVCRIKDEKFERLCRDMDARNEHIEELKRIIATQRATLDEIAKLSSSSRIRRIANGAL